MSNSGKSDHKHINFSQPWEINYVVQQYPKKDRLEIRELLNDLAKNKGSDNMTHDEVYEYLSSYGYEKE